MKRIIPILLAVMLCAVLFIACTEPEAPTVNMTETYATARKNFKTVCGIEVPAKANLEADDTNFEFFDENDTHYEFDIIGGSALNYQTYLEFENFFLDTLGPCDDGFPNGDEENDREALWTVEGRKYELFWNSDMTEFYINTWLP